MPARETKPINGGSTAFLILGEPNDAFLSQIAMFDLALRKVGSPLGEARLIAFVGSTDVATVPERWRPHLRNVDVRFTSPAEVRVRGYDAQARDRFSFSDCSFDYVIFVDADTILLGDIDEALRQLRLGVPAAGVIAYLPPPDFRAPRSDWIELSTEINGSPISFPYQYTLPHNVWGRNHPNASAPCYFNFGFVAFRADALREFNSPYLAMRDNVASRLPRYKDFAAQVAITLTMQALGWEPSALAFRYNFPNHDRALELHAFEAMNIRVLHYLRETNFTRGELFASREAFDAFVKLKPDGADKIVHDAIMRLTNGNYPF